MLSSVFLIVDVGTVLTAYVSFYLSELSVFFLISNTPIGVTSSGIDGFAICATIGVTTSYSRTGLVYDNRTLPVCLVSSYELPPLMLNIRNSELRMTTSITDRYLVHDRNPVIIYHVITVPIMALHTTRYL
jgi:hypothetical protein